MFVKIMEKGQNTSKFDPAGGLRLVGMLLEKLDGYPSLDNFAIRSLVCWAAFQQCMQMQQIKEAKTWIRKVVDLERCMLGEDDLRYRRMLRYQMDPMLWMSDTGQPVRPTK